MPLPVHCWFVWSLLGVHHPQGHLPLSSSPQTKSAEDLFKMGVSSFLYSLCVWAGGGGQEYFNVICLLHSFDVCVGLRH